MRTESDIGNNLQPLELLATALSGRALRIAHGAPGQLTWTDGATVFVEATASEPELLRALAVQTSLLAAGSLEPDILRKITRRQNLAQRYLAIEGHRALAANEALLPVRISSIIDRKIASLGDSPAASLAAALSRNTIEAPPQCFGIIHANRLLAANVVGKSKSESQFHTPRRQSQDLIELDDDEVDDGSGSSVAVDMFTVAGGSGPIGRWLQRFLSAARKGGSASGSPGMDAPTHRSRRTTPRAGKSVMSTATVGAVDEVVLQKSGLKYPEWDMYQRRYRPDWCTVQEIDAPLKEERLTPLPDTSSLRRPLARIGLGLSHCRRQTQGDDIDIDAAIEARIEVMAGAMPEENFYIDSLRRRRDLSVLILLDISGSVAEPGAQGQTMHEQQRATAAALASVLHNLGDRVALYAYNSQGRSFVQLVPLKRFDEHFNSLTMRRLYSLVPGAYSRLGTAIRHGAAVLEDQGGTSRRLLLVLSDGLAYDHGYELEYGAADARRALSEARRRGTGGLCLTMSDSADADSLRRVFGSAAHATISRSSQLVDVIGTLFNSALRSAEVKRRVS